jgi:Sec7-like guanine-nucleotide exchange factor
MEFYSAIKKNEIMLFADKWMEMENILSNISQAQKFIGLMFSLICGS